MPKSLPDLKGPARRIAASSRRAQASATDHATNAATDTETNTDEVTFAPEGYPASFTKGLPHGSNGIAESGYDAFTEAINRENTDEDVIVSFDDIHPDTTNKMLFKSTRDDGKPITWRGWESPRTGHYFDLQGPDADALGMAPAPALGSAELTAEMAEVYAMALLRDVPFSEIEDETGQDHGTGITVSEVLAALNQIPYFKDVPNAEETFARRRQSARLLDPGTEYAVATGIAYKKLPALTGHNLFRGSGPGAKKGPWVSQFMLLSDGDPAGTEGGKDPLSGQIAYGSQLIDQKGGFFPKGLDYMTNWSEWLDVQNGANLGEFNKISGYRFLTTPRDMATYVRFDALYQAYLNACLILLGQSSPSRSSLTLQAGFPDQGDTPRTGFASFGGPHILSLVTEVATRCLKFARRQKFNWHRRARPEKISGLLTLAVLEGGKQVPVLGPLTQTASADMAGQLGDLAHLVSKHNQQREANNTGERPFKGDQAPWLEDCEDGKNLLLAMAFPEGSPMHPAYAAGHATVAGGCVTMLKAFFKTLKDDNETPEDWAITGLPVVEAKPDAENSETSALHHVTGDRLHGMTLEGELNKLAANISIARNMAGVHYYSDYYDSLRMGERVAVGILVEQMSSYDEPVRLVFRSFDGEVITVSTAHPYAAKIDGDLSMYNSWMQRPQRQAGASASRSPLVG
ncbi:MAG: bromoperoxidase [Pseudomonadota bacterium]